MPLGLLASLVVLTAASWTLTLYQTCSMELPMGPSSAENIRCEYSTGSGWTAVPQQC